MLTGLTVVIYMSDLFKAPGPLIIGQGLMFLASIITIGEGSRLLVYTGRRWFSRYRGGLFIFLTGVILTTLVIALNILISHYIRTGEWDIAGLTKDYIYISNKKMGISWLGKSLFNALFIFPFLFGTYEYFFHAANQRFVTKKQEQLENEKLKAELQQLKGIINPHFLFNNLNSLYSLMEEDIERAQHFLNELTKVFRYLLRNNETILTSLEQELQFLQSYYRLLQIRFGTAINMIVRIDDQHLHFQIPPLTLQLLVENAVKHNQYSRDLPLTIQLYSDKDNKLVVSNNINLKTVPVESTGIGLQSIRMRYHMLNNPDPVVQRDENSFVVSMQLIDPAAVDSFRLA